jgi:haloacetate dehalogenase
MFKGFDRFDVTLGDVTLHGVRCGNGPPLLLLHGYPQTHAMWHLVAPVLAQTHTVIAADLRGYGRSSKPATTPDHAPYSKRAMAGDMVRLMAHFGHRRFAICAHDRGARVAHRLALDHPQAVDRMCLLDIAPTREMYAGTTAAFAQAYWHWFFLTRPAPMPERMIGADAEAFWRDKCGVSGANIDVFAPEALAEYLACWTAETIHAACEDYRAAATIDIAHDDADGGRRVDCPLLVLWGKNGAIARHFDALALWRLRASDVRGAAIGNGHYIPEECPDALLDQLLPFLAEPRKS